MRHSIAASESIQHREGDPLSCYQEWIGKSSSTARLLLVEFPLTAYWRTDKPLIPLTALYLETGSRVSISVTECELHSNGLPAAEQYARWSQEHGFASYVCGQAIALSPLAIPKPWGQEIWYTGVEARGVCRLGALDRQTPIPWLQAAVPGSELGSAGEALVLLKILDPVAEPVIGDLYFELHEEKREVYVVTHIDKAAWPDGTGYIRMGFAEEKLNQFAGDAAAFRESYLKAVQNYEVVRREIDALPAGAEADAELRRQESLLRGEMDSYSHLRPLRLGDVVKVPLLTPHSLQHGVRTVEFQTPVYERKILSFGQKVLTQDHWDTPEAVAQMRLEPAGVEEFETLVQREGVLVERIVDFSDFEVRRARLSGPGTLGLEPRAPYGLIMVVEGHLDVAGENFGPEQALMLPRGWHGELAPSQPAYPVVFLLAMPRN